MSWKCLIICLFQFFLIGSSGNEYEKASSSAYEALEKYDLPIGLLPQGAIGYTLNPFSGKFSAYLNASSCSFSLSNRYKLRYQTTISGVISKDHLKKLSGISVKVVKVWFKIKEVKKDGDHLEFSVGVTSAKFPVSSFEESPQCGCGFKCNSSRVINHFLSSS